MDESEEKNGENEQRKTKKEGLTVRLEKRRREEKKMKRKGKKCTVEGKG